MRRRELLTGGAAAAARPSAATAAPDELHAAFDAAARRLAPAGEAGPWRISDEPEESAAARFAAPGAALAALRAARPRRLNAAAELQWRTVEGGLARDAALAGGFPFGAAPGRPYVVFGRDGLHRRAEGGLGRAPRPDEADAYLEALGRLARGLDGETARLTAEARTWNAVPPRSPLGEVAARVARLAATPADASALVRPAPAAWRERAAARVETEVRPALARQAEALAGLRQTAPETAGAWSLRDGERYHAACLAAGLGLDLSAAETERRANSAVRRLTAELDAELRREGLTRGSVAERLRALGADPSGLAPDTEAGREAVVARMNATLAAVRARLGEVTSFAAGEAAVRRMSPADEAAARAGYREATSRGGDYVVDLHAVRERPLWTLAAVTLHETLPGHLLQLPLQLRRAPHPLVVRYATGAFEGWAVYAETLGEELGLYDRRERIGRLQSTLFRLSRAVADAGVHRRRWSPARARAELAGMYGFPLFNSFEAEVERLYASPGVGGADAFGALGLLALRRAAGGSARDFHDRVLATAPVPTRLLGAAVRLGVG